MPKSAAEDGADANADADAHAHADEQNKVGAAFDVNSDDSLFGGDTDEEDDNFDIEKLDLDAVDL